MYELPHELPNLNGIFAAEGAFVPTQEKKNLGKLGNFKKILETPGFDGEYPAVHPKAKFWRFLVKDYKKSAVKHSIEKSIFLLIYNLNFVNLSPTFCPRLLLKSTLLTSVFVLVNGIVFIRSNGLMVKYLIVCLMN